MRCPNCGIPFEFLEGSDLEGAIVIPRHKNPKTGKECSYFVPYGPSEKTADESAKK